ncbi:MAG: hypothetical protein ACD_58C00010G0004 [uncultured bacterium]|nr:MAG: hypothetical protein ACD_58C00010G0004 [uncultured bacterium]
MNYHIFILGCQYNYYDAKRITHLLEKMGYVLGTEKDADLIIVLACSVKQKSVDRIYGKIHNWNKLPQKPKIIVSACILENDKKRLKDRVMAIVDINQLLNGKLVNLLVRVSNKQSSNIQLYSEGLSFRVKSEMNNSYLPKGESKKTVYIPIMQGCDNYCTYCAVPYTRGREVSRPEKEIIKEINTQLKSGYKKILLLGQNVNSWNKKSLITYPICHSDGANATEEFRIGDTSLSLSMTTELPFAKLLQKIDRIPGDFSFNFMSSNPHDFTNDLIEKLSKLTKWEKVLHLPMQSGDNKILKKMNRKYNANQYCELITNLKSRISNLQLSTDVIVGFPSETKVQFQNTVKICKKIGFCKVFVSQYSPRPNTVSATTMVDNITKEEKKRRWDILNNLINKK